MTIFLCIMHKSLCERLYLNMSEEENFHLKGFVNKQNFSYLSDANLRCPWEEDPNYSEKVLFWCAVKSHSRVGPYLFQDANGHTANIKMLHCNIKRLSCSSPQ